MNRYTTLSLPTLRLPSVMTLFTFGAIAYLFALTGLYTHADSGQMMQMFIFFVFFFAVHTTVQTFILRVTSDEVSYHPNISKAMSVFRGVAKLFVVLAVLHIIVTAFFGLNLNSMFVEKVLFSKLSGLNFQVDSAQVFNYAQSKAVFLSVLVGYPLVTLVVYGGLAIANKR